MKKEFFSQSVLQAEQLCAEGKGAIPRDGTPLANLVLALSPFNAIPLPSGETVLSQEIKTVYKFSEDVEYLTNADSVFNKSLQAIADDIAPFVTAHISTAKNVVVPLVIEAEEAFTKFLETTALPPAQRDFCIKGVQLPAILADESFRGMGIDEFKDAQEGHPHASKVTLKNPDAIDAIVAGASNLGNERLNGLLADWLANANYEQLRRVLMTNFFAYDAVDCTSELNEKGQRRSDGQLTYFATSYSLTNTGVSAFTRLDNALATYLLATWLSNNVQESTGSLADYKTEMEICRAEAASVIFALLRRINIQIETNTMIVEYSRINKEIVVLQPLYKNWLENGGSPEVLFGMLVSDCSYFSVEIINSHLDEGKRAWDDYLLYNNSLNEVRAFDAFSSFVISFMTNKLQSLTEVEKAYLAGSSEIAHRDRVISLVKAEMEHFGHRLLDDVLHLALHLVAKSRFFFTSSYIILSEMNDAHGINKDIDPREAAGLAVIKYVVQYLVDQTTPAQK